MALLKSSTQQVFDTAGIFKGNLISAQYEGWEEAKLGFVTEVSDDELKILFPTGTGSFTNYMVVTAAEVIAGTWALRWTADLITVNTYGVEDGGGS